MRFLLALAFALVAGLAQAQTVGPAPIYCNKIAASATLTAGTTELVTGVAGKQISVCGYEVDGLAAGTLQFVFGTGSSCTSATNISHNWTTAANQHLFSRGSVAFLSSAAGQSACAVVTGTNSVALTFYYSLIP